MPKSFIEFLSEAPQKNKHFNQVMAAVKTKQQAIARLQDELKRTSKHVNPSKVKQIKQSIKQNQDAIKQIRMTGRPS